MLAFGFASFLAFGLVLVLVGANQAHLETELGLTLAQSGLLSSALAGGIGVGVVGAGPLFDRYPRRPLFAVSMLMAAAALLAADAELAFSGWLLLLALTGIGIGAYDTLLNAAVVERYGEASARPMTVIHAAATLGAIGGPPLVALLAANEIDWVRSFHAAGAAHLALAVASLLVPLPERPGERAEAKGGGSLAGASALVPFALIAFAYVGIEAAMTVFAVPYAGALGLPETRGQFGISSFWLGLFAGRLGILLLRGTLGANVLLVSGGVGTLLLVAAGLDTGLPPEAGFFAVGLALGCVYPVMITHAGLAMPHARGLAAGLAAGAGSLGGFLIPWTTGATGDAIGVVFAVASLALWSALIALAAGAARRDR